MIITAAARSSAPGMNLALFIKPLCCDTSGNMLASTSDMGKRILLHVCCGPCSTSSVERLIAEGYTPVLFFSDSNIFPYEEFRKRYDNLLIVAEHYNLDVILDDWEHDKWLKAVEGHEKDPEHGARCSICFDYNLHRAAAKAAELGIDEFTTTLTVSRFKKSESIFSEGRKYAGFKEIDFKKKDGFNKSIILSRELGLYRQQWCGCEFSRRGE